MELNLASIRESLIRQEDTIIYNLLERAQYSRNLPAYNADLLTIPGFEGSLFKYLITEAERSQAKVGRYSREGEHPYVEDGLQESLLLPDLQKSNARVLYKAADQININSQIWRVYFGNLLPGLAADGDDGNYVAAASCDIMCLQALSKRIHFGKFVAEAKFRDSPNVYETHIRARDVQALYKLITFESVELDVQRRVENKARAYGQEVGIDGPRPETLKIDPQVVGRFYRDWIIPFTKKVQIDYLLHRLDEERKTEV